MIFAYGAITRWGHASQHVPLTIYFVTSYMQACYRYPTTPMYRSTSVWAPSVSLAATQEIPGIPFLSINGRSKRTKLRVLVSFPPGTKMFQFPGYASVSKDRSLVKLVGFPHSEISGSKVARHLPEAYRSRLRLSSPH